MLKDFLSYQAQTSPHPLGLEVSHAKGSYIFDTSGKAHLDFEASLKLARKATGRTEILFAHNAYHGNTMGSMSVMDYEERKKPFEPLIPDCHPIEFNNEAHLERITSKTAAVILETIQGGAGFILPKDNYLQKVKQRCEEVGAKLILDEIQPGFGRTGKLFGFQHFDVVPDILVMGKGMGGGLPIGAFTASNELMSHLKDNPKLGHITTFGGNPVIAAAALATLKEITETSLMKDALAKENTFKKLLKHPLIKEVRGKGLMLAVMVESAEMASEIILSCKERGLILFWLLFEGKAIRITPPLTISEEEIEKGCAILTEVLNTINTKK